MACLQAHVRITVNGEQMADKTVMLDTDEFGTPWLEFISSITDVARDARDAAFRRMEMGD